MPKMWHCLSTLHPAANTVDLSPRYFCPARPQLNGECGGGDGGAGGDFLTTLGCVPYCCIVEDGVVDCATFTFL